MHHFQTSSTTNKNNPVVDSKPPRVTRSSLDTRNINSQSINTGSVHRQTSIVKSPSSPSPTPTSTRNNLNNNELLTQNSHRVHRKAPKESSYLPQKRTDSALSSSNNNQKTNKFLDNCSSDSDDNNNNNLKIKSSKRHVNNFLDKDTDSNTTIANCIFSVDGKSADVEIDDKRISWKYISSCNKNDFFVNFVAFITILNFIALEDIPNSKRSGSNSKRNTYENSKLYEIPYERLFSVEPKRTKNSLIAQNFEHRFSLSDDFTIEGFLLHVFERSKPNIYRHRCITFSHPHRQTCKQWLSNLYERANCKKVFLKRNLYKIFFF